jgi:hypothetical protein
LPSADRIHLQKCATDFSCRRPRPRRQAQSINVFIFS